MPINIGDAILKLKLDQSELDAAMKNIPASFGKQTAIIGGAMAAMGGTIMAGLLLSAKGFAETGHELEIMALRTGFSAEALAEWGYVAKVTGADVSDLAVAVRTMSSVITDAGNGSDMATEALKRLGLTTEELKGLAPEQQFDRMVTALSRITDVTTRSAAAQDLFGRGALTLLPLLAKGADGVQKLKDEYHKLGGVWDEETITKALELAEAMNRLKTSTKNLKDELGLALAPVLTTASDLLTDIVVGLVGWVKENSDTVVFIGSIAGAFTAVGTALVALTAISKGLTFALGGAVAALGAPVAVVAAIAAAAAISLGVLGYGLYLLWQYHDIQTKNAAMEAAYQEALKGNNAEYVKLLKAKKDLTQEEKNYLEAVEATMLAQQERDEALGKSLTAVTDAQNKYYEGSDSILTARQKEYEALLRLHEQYAGLLETYPNLTSEQNIYIESVDRAVKSWIDYVAQLLQWQAAVNGMKAAMQGWYSSGGLSLGGDFAAAWNLASDVYGRNQAMWNALMAAGRTAEAAELERIVSEGPSTGPGSWIIHNVIELDGRVVAESLGDMTAQRSQVEGY